MKILNITAQKPHSTGSGTYLTELVNAFDRAGHTQAVVCGIYIDDTVEFPSGVACYPVFFTDNIISFDRNYTSPAEASDELFASCKRNVSIPSADSSALPFAITGMSDIMPYHSTRYRDLTPYMIAQFEDAFISTIRRVVEDLEPDLIICHHLFLLTSLVRKHFPRNRIIGISHGTDLRQMVNCRELGDMVKPYIDKLDLVYALHDEQKKQVLEIFDIDEGRVDVIGSGYNAALFNTEGRKNRLPGEPLRITYAGKISRPKGVPELLKAMSTVCRKYMDRTGDIGEIMLPFELTLAGGCQDETLKPFLDNLPPYVKWLGQIPQPALAELLRQTDIFVLPSYFEGLPLVLIEAMASGALPISTDLPGVKSWIDSNIDNPNVIYLPMPQMSSIDEPTESGRKAMTDNLTQALASLIDLMEFKRLDIPAPDTSRITWDALAGHIIGSKN